MIKKVKVSSDIYEKYINSVLDGLNKKEISELPLPVLAMAETYKEIAGLELEVSKEEEIMVQVIIPQSLTKVKQRHRDRGVFIQKKYISNLKENEN